MKAISLLVAFALGIKLSDVPQADDSLLGVDQTLVSDAVMLTDLKASMKLVESTLIKKQSPKCDSKCQAQIDSNAGNEIKQMTTPLHSIVQSCKTNFETYTKLFEPDSDHVHKMT